MDQTQILAWLVGMGGVALAANGIYNTIANRRGADALRALERKKTREDESVEERKLLLSGHTQLIAELRKDNAELRTEVRELRNQFDHFKELSDKRDEDYKLKITANTARAERTHGQLMFLRREIMALFKRIALLNPGPEVSAEMAAFVRSVHDEQGPLGENPVMIGAEERQQGE